MIYFLKVENTSGYRQNCHYCDTSTCRENCALPFDDSVTVLDMLQKVGQEDNISFYHGDKGRKDFILNLVWAAEFESPFQRHLSAVQGEHERVETFDPSAENRKTEVTIDDCFEEFKKPELLDEDNMWYCNKCKTHV